MIALDQDGRNELGVGTLDAINNEVDSTTGTIKLKARFDNNDRKLWPGGFVQVQVVVQTEVERHCHPIAGGPARSRWTLPVGGVD